MAQRRAATVGKFQPPPTISRRDYFRHGSDEWFREAIYSAVRALRGLLACRDAFGRALHLTASQFAVLMGVAYRQKRQGVSIRDLADHISLAPTHVTTDVGRMIRKGYLVKRPSPSDRRSVLVSLSPKGEAAITGVAPLVRRINDLLFLDIDAPSVDRVSRIMGRLTANSELAMGEIRRLERSGQPALRPDRGTGAPVTARGR
jgi:DNA-binding MarR family transcriptional regulator